MRHASTPRKCYPVPPSTALLSQIEASNANYLARRVDVDGQPVGFVRVAAPLDSMEENLATLHRALFIFGAVALVLGLLAAAVAAGTSLLSAPHSASAGAANEKVVLAVAAGTALVDLVPLAGLDVGTGEQPLLRRRV